ncbi:MAG: YkgJ family cysteine cluster protein [Candidatus Bathyarchaeia archaeon]|jgi:Fe-S-cluster containining protein
MRANPALDSRTLIGIIEEGTIEWHRTTPRRFKCDPACTCCCLNPFFFPSEVDLLPEDIRKRLTTRSLSLALGKIELQAEVFAPKPLVEGNSKTCIFFDPNSSKHCTIYRERPLRCRLYPYCPLIVAERIVIVAEPFLNIFDRDGSVPRWYRCHGLGKGDDVTRPVEEQSRIFLQRLLTEYPYLVGAYFVKNLEAAINWEKIREYHALGRVPTALTAGRT